jgi:type IV pilus assembly protein PilO
MKKFDLNNIHEWPLATRCVVIALICVIVFYIGFKWDIAALQKKMQTSQAEENDLKLQYQAVIKKQIAARAELIHFNEMRVLLTQWQQKLVRYNELPELLNQILKIGNNNSLYFSLFDPGDGVKDNNYQKIPIKIIAAATYHQLADFISQIANLPWIIVIDNFGISNENRNDVLGTKLAEAANSQNLLTLSLILDVYYKPESPPEPKPENEKHE